jgi:hypothetical protein
MLYVDTIMFFALSHVGFNRFTPFNFFLLFCFLFSVFCLFSVAVAISRVRSLAGLSMSHPLQPAQVRAHPVVVRFYDQLAGQGSNTGTGTEKEKEKVAQVAAENRQDQRNTQLVKNALVKAAVSSANIGDTVITSSTTAIVNVDDW